MPELGPQQEGLLVVRRAREEQRGLEQQEVLRRAEQQELALRLGQVLQEERQVPVLQVLEQQEVALLRLRRGRRLRLWIAGYLQQLNPPL